MAWLTGPERLTELERYGLLRAVEAAIVDADEAVDALGDHADHLADAKALARQRAARAEAERALAAGEAGLAEDLAAWGRGWEAIWRLLPLPRAPDPRDALACRRALEGAREAALRLANVRQRASALEPALVAFEARLRRHLRQEHAGWPLLVKLLREREREAQARRGRRESTRERLASIEAARELTLGLLESSREREAALRDELRSRLGEIGLRRDLDPQEALRRLERLADARARGALLGPREVALREREAALAELEAESQALLRRLEIDVGARALVDHLEELARRLASARGANLARAHAREALAQRAPLLEQARAHAAELERQLVDLRARARVDGDEALKAAAERALRRDHDLARVAELERRQEERLGPPGEARSALEAALGDADPAALRAELARIDPRLAALERQRTGLAEQKGKLDQEIESLGGDRAARLGAEVQSLLAELAERVDRYLLVHLAERILNRVTDRFADENQPAILGQTSSLLARITGGRHLRVSADRQAGTLVVHDAAGVARLPRELSTGTREQLFLALRLAYILEYCDRAEPLPVIIDDVLVNFDRARARSTLLALCEVARSAQVLLFTCHHHIVDIVRAVARRCRSSSCRPSTPRSGRSTRSPSRSIQRPRARRRSAPVTSVARGDRARRSPDLTAKQSTCHLSRTESVATCASPDRVRRRRPSSRGGAATSRQELDAGPDRGRMLVFHAMAGAMRGTA
ncbi:MAG: hypothetical protein H6711_21260 [Myxococcales bacterium]|nr:hypothetical protein [Myxococcales bacterium]